MLEIIWKFVSRQKIILFFGENSAFVDLFKKLHKKENNTGLRRTRWKIVSVNKRTTFNGYWVTCYTSTSQQFAFQPRLTNSLAQ